MHPIENSKLSNRWLDARKNCSSFRIVSISRVVDLRSTLRRFLGKAAECSLDKSPLLFVITMQTIEAFEEAPTQDEFEQLARFFGVRPIILVIGYRDGKSKSFLKEDSSKNFVECSDFPQQLAPKGFLRFTGFFNHFLSLTLWRFRSNLMIGVANRSALQVRFLKLFKESE